jgi:hypothetical protein
MGERALYLNPWQMWRLNEACRAISHAFGSCPYLVGSALKRADFRDVDVRLIIDDALFARLYPSAGKDPHRDGYWMLVCASISTWLADTTGLPIDFQIQAMTPANAEFDGPRSALGCNYTVPMSDPTPAHEKE